MADYLHCGFFDHSKNPQTVKFAIKCATVCPDKHCNTLFAITLLVIQHYDWRELLEPRSGTAFLGVSAVSR